MVDLTGAVSNAAALQLAFNNRPHAIQPNRCRQRRVPGQLSGPQRCSQHDICSRCNSCCAGMQRHLVHCCSLRCCPGNGDGHSQGLRQCIGSGHSPRYVALITCNILLSSFPPSDRGHDTVSIPLKTIVHTALRCWPGLRECRSISPCRRHRRRFCCGPRLCGRHQPVLYGSGGGSSQCF